MCPFGAALTSGACLKARRVQATWEFPVLLGVLLGLRTTTKSPRTDVPTYQMSTIKEYDLTSPRRSNEPTTAHDAAARRIFGSAATTVQIDDSKWRLSPQHRHVPHLLGDPSERSARQGLWPRDHSVADPPNTMDQKIPCNVVFWVRHSRPISLLKASDNGERRPASLSRMWRIERDVGPGSLLPAQGVSGPISRTPSQWSYPSTKHEYSANFRSRSITWPCGHYAFKFLDRI
jgi:hypothetical protein